MYDIDFSCLDPIHHVLENVGDYLQDVHDVYTCIEGKDVLEIAAQTGTLLPLFLKFIPKSYIGIEPDAGSYHILNLRLNKVKTFPAEALNLQYENFTTRKNIDVVICNGLLYHLHSPFHLIEYLGNLGADTIILETTGTENDLSNKMFLRGEPVGDAGNRQTDNNPLNFTLHIGSSVMISAFEQLGYELSCKRHTALPQVASKHNVNTYIFEKTL